MTLLLKEKTCRGILFLAELKLLRSKCPKNILFSRWCYRYKSRTGISYNSFSFSIRSSANEDGVSSRGSAGGGDCCEWDGESADHPGTDRHFGTGNSRWLSPETEHIEKAVLCMSENTTFASVKINENSLCLKATGCVTSGSRYLWRQATPQPQGRR